ncbi:MAG: type 1 glutamine amidotransferase, partial [Burkholderiaceae bacterium]|nr:type 1 glutamine amidotransferase [Burkholderiaceae bacterium]
VERDKAVLGICLGAQLIANAFGAKVYPNRQKEIGWFPIENLADDTALFRFPPLATVFHWHGETFDLPSAAVRLARSAACENQAFQLGSKVIGLQFHLETTLESADAIITHCLNELTAGEYVQDEPTLRAAPFSAYRDVNRIMATLLDYLTRQLV